MPMKRDCGIGGLPSYNEHSQLTCDLAGYVFLVSWSTTYTNSQLFRREFSLSCEVGFQRSPAGRRHLPRWSSFVS